MRKLTENKTIYDKIEAARMTEADRKVALQAMRDAELIVGAIVWTTRKIERLLSLSFLKPSLKH